jgi:hypothetical protein
MSIFEHWPFRAVTAALSRRGRSTHSLTRAPGGPHFRSEACQGLTLELKEHPRKYREGRPNSGTGSRERIPSVAIARPAVGERSRVGEVSKSPRKRGRSLPFVVPQLDGP